MNVHFDHTIVKVRDKRRAAGFYAGLLGLGPATAFGPFLELRTANGVSLDFADTEGDPQPMHYAFLVGNAEFDDILARIRQRGLAFWADPFQREPQVIDTEDGSRGVYWEDPDGHLLEMLTRRDGGGA